LSEHPVIAIDGPAASGKGTLARKLAEKLGYAHLDTGALYRAVGWHVLETGGDPADCVCATGAAAWLKGNLTPDVLGDKRLRSDEAGQAASKVAAIPEVRSILLNAQKEFAQRPPDLPDGTPAAGAVLDGRDIGTVICPAADVKIFVTASTQIRAERRAKELQERGITVKYSAVLKDMQERDTRDSSRKVAPMAPAEDAFVLDTSELAMDAVLEEALRIVRTKLIAAPN